jgi:hypothetical protein
MPCRREKLLPEISPKANANLQSHARIGSDDVRSLSVGLRLDLSSLSLTAAVD